MDDGFCRRRVWPGLLMSASLALSPALPFEVPLSDNSVREAYFLGQRADQKLADFLSLYRHALPLPERGPYVAEIRLLTPYARVVVESNRHTVGYSAQQAAADYRGRGDTILIQVRIELTPTFTYADADHLAQERGGELHRHLEPEDFWRALPIHVSQTRAAHEETTLQPFDVHAEPIYGYAGRDSGGSYIGALVSLEYDAAQFDSAPTHVEIVTTTSYRAITNFDLTALR